MRALMGENPFTGQIGCRVWMPMSEIDELLDFGYEGFAGL